MWGNLLDDVLIPTDDVQRKFLKTKKRKSYQLKIWGEDGGWVGGW